jgi:curved DNA-binding protein CbpA
VITAVRRAQDLLGAAWEVLGDPQSRKRYDETVRWLDRQRQRNRPSAVPDVRGLFYDVCLEVAIRHKLHVRTIRLTEHPMAVDGLVVDQDPSPSAKAHRGTTLTVRLWHPPAPSPRTRRTTALTV